MRELYNQMVMEKNQIKGDGSLHSRFCDATNLVQIGGIKKMDAEKEMVVSAYDLRKGVVRESGESVILKRKSLPFFQDFLSLEKKAIYHTGRYSGGYIHMPATAVLVIMLSSSSLSSWA